MAKTKCSEYISGFRYHDRYVPLTKHALYKNIFTAWRPVGRPWLSLLIESNISKRLDTCETIYRLPRKRRRIYIWIKTILLILKPRQIPLIYTAVYSDVTKEIEAHQNKLGKMQWSFTSSAETIRFLTKFSAGCRYNRQQDPAYLRQNRYRSPAKFGFLRAPELSRGWPLLSSRKNDSTSLIPSSMPAAGKICSGHQRSGTRMLYRMSHKVTAFIALIMSSCN